MILVIDTVRQSGEHLELNNTVLEELISSGHEVVFLTSEEYWESFSMRVKETARLQKVVYNPSGFKGTLKTLALSCKLVRKQRKFAKVIFLSSITYNSLFLSILSRLNFFNINIFIFLHELSYITSSNPSQKRAGKALELALKFGLSEGSKFVIIGEYIKKGLEKRIIPSRDSLVFIEHPTSTISESSRNENFDILHIAAVGVQNLEKNSHKIEALVHHKFYSSYRGKVEFSTIGRLSYRFDPLANIYHYGLNYDSYLIPYEDYKKFIQQQHFLLFFIGEEYDLKTSGTIFDAIKFQKPILALRSNLTSFYFEKFGNIGYLYNNIEEMSCGISELCNNFDETLYQKQITNLKCAYDATSSNKFSKDFERVLYNAS